MTKTIAIIGGGNLGSAVASGLNEMEHRDFNSALIKGVKTSFKKIS